jgi:hypothetical protein
LVLGDNAISSGSRWRDAREPNRLAGCSDIEV